MNIDFNSTWLNAIDYIMENGSVIRPQDGASVEVLHETFRVDMRTPVLTIPQRHLDYQFMAAGAYWMLLGDNRIKTIEPYKSSIAALSDDGATLYSAYGPRVMSQLYYIVRKLEEDRYTREAGLTIWSESPKESKSPPCAVSVFFSKKNSKLNCHVFMRSLDMWSGFLYDTFNFSMLSHLVCSIINKDGGSNVITEPGTLYLTSVSSHLYQHDFNSAAKCFYSAELCGQRAIPATPRSMFTDREHIIDRLWKLKDSNPGDSERWWEVVSGEVEAGCGKFL